MAAKEAFFKIEKPYTNILHIITNTHAKKHTLSYMTPAVSSLQEGKQNKSMSGREGAGLWEDAASLSFLQDNS